MKFAVSWLNDWVESGLSVDELAQRMTVAGLEVDSVTSDGEGLDDVVIAEVLSAEKHPQADRLNVCRVVAGDGEPVEIVCGAPNVRAGLKTALARPGTRLPNGMKLRRSKIRGVVSNGMLCSWSELGLCDDHDGILELPADTPVGTDFRQLLQLDDISIEVDLTPNRADCLGIKGIAREVGVLTRTDVNHLAIEPVAPVSDSKRNISLQAPSACPRYLGRVIENINMDAVTPLWMKERLRRSGIRSIDPVVDVTNYVLLELGHPMHAFDNDVLEGDILVRLATPEEKLVLLDGEEVGLNTDTLVIADEKKPLAMAGIFGGKASGVTDNSRNIFLESAFFAPDAIMGRARQYGLHTDASHRYERGVDPQLQRDAMERATALLLEIVGGTPGPVVEAKSQAF